MPGTMARWLDDNSICCHHFQPSLHDLKGHPAKPLDNAALSLVAGSKFRELNDPSAFGHIVGRAGR